MTTVKFNKTATIIDLLKELGLDVSYSEFSTVFKRRYNKSVTDGTFYTVRADLRRQAASESRIRPSDFNNHTNGQEKKTELPITYSGMSFEQFKQIVEIFEKPGEIHTMDEAFARMDEVIAVAGDYTRAKEAILLINKLKNS